MKKSKGFTLIEVLIASVIMFSVVALTALVYSNSAIATTKAQRAIKIASMLPLLQETIESDLFHSLQNEVSSQGEFEGVEFRWSAKVFRAEHMLQNAMSADINNKRSYIWNVTLEIQLKNIIRIYEYQEFTYRQF
jgi:prepilin-type N-terminal cleavage/methylation domain-containing protein